MLFNNYSKSKEIMIKENNRCTNYATTSKVNETDVFNTFQSIYNLPMIPCLIKMYQSSFIVKSILIFAVLHFTLFGFASNEVDDIPITTINQTDEYGRKQGKWIIYGKDDPEKGYPMQGKISEGFYKNDKKNGEWITYYKDGVTPKLIGEFDLNRPNGYFKRYYPNGNLKVEAVLYNMHYIGTLKRYSKDGVLIFQADYNEKGAETGEVKHFYTNGTLKFIYNADNGFPIGKATRYWSNGEIKEQIIYSENGVLMSTTGIIPKTIPETREDLPELIEVIKYASN